MKINEVNVYKGKVKKVVEGEKNSKVTVELKSGEQVVSVVENDKVKNLKLKKGVKVMTAVKAADVKLAVR